MFSNDSDDDDGRDFDPTLLPKRRFTVSLAAYVRRYWKDYATMLILGVVGTVVYFLPPLPSRRFPLVFTDSQVGGSFGGDSARSVKPVASYILPIWFDAILAFCGPMIVISLIQVRYKNVEDWNAGLLGLLYSLVTAWFVQVFIKWLVGGLSPDFYAVCSPNINQPPVTTEGDPTPQGSTVCTANAKEISVSLESVPSMHSTCAFAGFVYLSVYLNAHLKVFSKTRPAYWKFAFFFAPILAAVLTAGTQTNDRFNAWMDVVGGGIIGTLTAVTGYRSHFTSVLDSQTNDLVLPDFIVAKRPDSSDGGTVELGHTAAEHVEDRHEVQVVVPDART